MYSSPFLFVFTGFSGFFNVGVVYWSTLSVPPMRIGVLF